MSVQETEKSGEKSFAKDAIKTLSQVPYRRAQPLSFFPALPTVS